MDLYLKRDMKSYKEWVLIGDLAPVNVNSGFLVQDADKFPCI